jgi:hypothetical protein
LSDIIEKPWPEVVFVKHLGGTVLHVTFDDGAEGEIDLSKRLRLDGVFAPLNDPNYVAQVRVDEDGGTIAWPNGADIAPETLYEKLLHAGKSLKRPRKKPRAA